MTPRELERRLRAGNQRSRKSRNELMSAAWHGAMWSRAQKMPKHRDILDTGDTKKPQSQTWQERMAIAQQWQAVTKG